MNCNRRQRQILLAQSGELSERDRAALDAHLAACSECQAFMTEAADVAALARPALRTGEARHAGIEPIRDEASRLASAGTLIRFVRPFYAQIAACAAALFLAAGVWIMLPSPRATTDPIHDVGALMSMVSEAHDGVVSVPANGTESSRLQALAGELLRMEGLAPDDML